MAWNCGRAAYESVLVRGRCGGMKTKVKSMARGILLRTHSQGQGMFVAKIFKNKNVLKEVESSKAMQKSKKAYCQKLYIFISPT